MSEVRNALFLCTANSARSILAEAILNRAGRGRFRAFSAGSQPSGKVHPYALQLLESMNFDTAFARSKSWDEFAEPGAPQMEFIFTVCDSAANESCPVWPGHPMTALWSVPDPKRAEGNEAEMHLAFAEAFPHAQQPHLGLPQPADGDARQAGAAAAPRRNRSGRGKGELSRPRRLAASLRLGCRRRPIPAGSGAFGE